MASATATWTPSSLQLRLALSSGVRRKSHAVYLRPSRFARKSGCGVVCVSQKPEVDAWTGSDSSKSSADNLAGWDDSGNDNKKSPRAKKKSLIEGVVGAGVAGIILFVGLSYAAASFTKRTKKQEMQSLTSQQESMLQSSDEISSDEIKVAKSEENNLKDEGRSIENNDIVQPGDEGSVEKKKETSSLDGVMPDETDATERIPQNTPEADLMINVEPDLETAESEKIISESKSLLDSSTEPVLLDSESSNLAGAENPTSEDPDSLLNTEPTNVSDLENRVNSLKEDSLSSLYDIDAYGATGTVTEELPEISPLNDTGTSFSTVTEELPEVNGTPEYLAAGSMSSISDIDTTKETESSKTPVPELTDRAKDELNMNSQDELDNGPPLEIPSGGSAFSSAGIPAPFMSVLVNPGKILVPAAADQVQCQAFAALQVLKVIETDTQPSDLCTRREYARWLVSASSALSRNTISKVYPAMYIENVTEPAFDDVTPEDPDFSSIQGLAEAGLITSKLSNRDLLDDVEGTFLFSPESLLSRQDLISWKMALEKRQLPEADKKMLYELSGFIDIEKINPDAWPAIIADLSTGEQGIAALAFGCTRLFQPHKPVTKGQAAIALSSGEASDIVSEELARIEAESMAEKAVSAHNALVAEVEKDVNASFEKELSMEREKIEAVEKMAELAKVELEQLREKREEENLALVKERAAVESEMEVLSRLRREAEDKLEDLMSKKAEVSFEKERVSNLRKEAEEESQRISKLQYELEVERKALSMARSWAEEEAKRAKEQGRALEEARKRWETNGLRVVVDKDLQETGTGETEQSILLNSVERSSVEETEERAKTLMDKLKEMAGTVGGKSREVIFIVMEKIRLWITILKEYTENLGQRTGEMRDVAIVKAKVAAEEVGKGTVQVSDKVKRMAEECRDGVGKISQRFKT